MGPTSTKGARHGWLVLAALGSLLCHLAPPTLHAQEGQRATVTGTVIDRVTEDPLEGVEIRLPELELTLTTNADGHFVLTDIAVGTYRMELERAGYEPASGQFTIDRPGTFTLALTPAAPGAAEGMNIESREDVLTAAEIAPHDMTTAMELIQQLRPAWLRTRGTRSFGGPISPRVIVDALTPQDASILETIHRDSILEMRYLTPQEATLRYGTGFPAGAIVVRTK
jgi:hypothetical protein